MRSKYYDLILTQRGVLKHHELKKGDQCFSWHSGRPLNIFDVKWKEPRDYFRITYSNGQSRFFLPNESVLFQNVFGLQNPVTAEDIWRFQQDERQGISIADYPLNVKWYPEIQFDEDRYPLLEPDAYTAGSILMTADYDDDNLHVPETIWNYAASFVGNRYTIQATVALGAVNRIHFRRLDSEQLIKFQQIFREYPDNMVEPENRRIPEEYFFQSVHRRWEFIRGVCDVSAAVGDRGIIIVNRYKERLMQVKELLLTLGISSRYMRHGHQHFLQILCTSRQLPHFFYIVPKKTIAISIAQMSYVHDVINTMESIKLIKNTDNVRLHNIVTEKPNQLYVSGEYLPKYALNH